MVRPPSHAILGAPLLAVPQFHVVHPWRARNIVPIERELRTFLTDQIEEFRPHRIVVIERKGTAIVRALKSWDKDPLVWPWRDVVSSVAVEALPEKWFRGKRVLVFDDMMRSGDHLIDVFASSGFDRLWRLAEDVRVAIFAVHEKGCRGRLFREHKIPHAWFYNDLTTPAYRHIRFQIVEMLQRAGSLMLDTEHIEMRVELRGSLGRFVGALSRKADAVAFRSANRTNITVYYQDDDAHELPKELFPKGTRLTNIVKKCRIVQREGDMFALIPMCYPSVPGLEVNWPIRAEYGKLLGPDVRKSGDARFYGVALIAALCVLKWVLRDLAASDPDLYRLHLPLSPQEDLSDDAYSLEHLHVMFRTVDLTQLTHLMAEIERKATSDGTLLRKRKLEPRQPRHWPDDVLREDAIALLQVIREVLDQRLSERRMRGQGTRVHPYGLRATEIFELGRPLGWETARISCLFDILIDEAALVTHVERITDQSGRERWVRTFEPDGEIVSDLARRLTRQLGLPQGF